MASNISTVQWTDYYIVLRSTQPTDNQCTSIQIYKDKKNVWLVDS